MQLIASEVTKKYRNDSKKQLIYKLDSYLTAVMSKYPQSLSILYGELIQGKTDLIKLTEKIYRDFSVTYCSVDVKDDEKDNESCFTPYKNKISYSQYCYKTNDIEIVLHEVAHLLEDEIFDFNYTVAHNPFFSSILKHLFLHYDVLSKEKFDLAEKALNYEVPFLDEALVKIEQISIDEATKIINSLDFTVAKKSDSYEKYVFKDEKSNLSHVIVKDYNNNSSIYTVRKLLGYEINNNPFSKLSDEELLNTNFYSPIFKMDSNGFQVTSRTYDDMLGFTIVWVEKEDNGRLITKKRHITGYDKEELKQKLKKYIFKCKIEGRKHKRFYTIDDFESGIIKIYEVCNNRTGHIPISLCG